jgi:hypothetical protein
MEFVHELYLLVADQRDDELQPEPPGHCWLLDHGPGAYAQAQSRPVTEQQAQQYKMICVRANMNACVWAPAKCW